jgi:hypothetical protein
MGAADVVVVVVAVANKEPFWTKTMMLMMQKK